jgi:hypothetical protein
MNGVQSNSKGISIHGVSARTVELLGLLILASLYGWLPPFLNYSDLSGAVTEIGAAECLSNSRPIFALYCKNNAIPGGILSSSSLPFYWAVNFFSFLNLSPETSFAMVGFLTLTVAFYSTLRLKKNLGCSFVVRLITTFLIFSHPLFQKQAGFGFMQHAFLLLPVFLLFHMELLKVFNLLGLVKRFLGLAGLIGFKAVLLFTNGYAFLFALLIEFCILLNLGKELFSLKRISVWIAGLGLSSIVPVFLYKSIQPSGGEFDVMPIDFFRQQGASIEEIVFRPEVFKSVVGFSGSYLGVMSLAFFLCYLFWRPRPAGILQKHKALLVSLFIISILVSLGPSLKVFQIDTIPKSGPVSFSDYLLPKGQATWDFPWGDFYIRIPGIQFARAISRFLTLSLISSLIIAAIFIQYIRERFGISFALLALVLLFLDLRPDYVKIVTQNRSIQEQLPQIKQDLVDPLNVITFDRSKVLFVSSENDYLSLYIAPKAKLQTYNLGGDKEIVIARRRWPALVNKIRNGENIMENVKVGIADGTFSAVIFPHFNLRWDAYSWPPAETTRLEKQSSYGEIEKYFKDRKVSVFTWFTLIE